MNERRATASEVIKVLEAKLSQASELIDDVDRLLAQAAEIEASAKDYALRSLGPIHGDAAFDLALVSYPSLAAKRGLLGVSSGKPMESLPKPLPADRPLPSPAAVSPIEVSTLHGVEFPSARFDEAQAIVAEAIAHRRAGGTSNVYASNRGKNAWRRSLFKAALDSAGSAAATPVDSVHTETPGVPEPDEPPTIPKDSASPAPTAAAPAWEEDPLDDPVGGSFPTPSVSDVPSTAPAPQVLDVPPTSPEETVLPPARPALGLRRPSYGNSNPKPEGLAEAIQTMRDNGKDPTVPPPAARPRFNKPGFLRKGKPT